MNILARDRRLLSLIDRLQATRSTAMTAQTPAQREPLVKLATLSSVQSSPLDAILHDAARKLLNLRLTNIRGSGDLDDAKALNQDLDVLGKIIDPVIEAIGWYAHDKLGLEARLAERYFTDVLKTAIEGTLDFHITEAGKQATENLIGHELVDA